MNTLFALGLGDGESRVMLIEPPDAVLAEAASVRPRPSVASTLQVAEPTPRIAWWPDARHLDERPLSRLLWMVSVAQGEAWIVAGSDEEAPTPGDVRTALEASQFTTEEERAMDDGSTAFRVTAPRA